MQLRGLVATALIQAAQGGTASDDGQLYLFIPPGALLTNTTVTIVAEAIAPIGAQRVLRAWRVVADPAPTVLNAAAHLSVAVPPGEPPGGLVVRVAEDVSALDSDWRALAITTRSHLWLDAEIGHLPPSHGPPPRRSSALICLCSPAATAAREG